MELEFDRDVIHCYEILGEGTVCQEETMESIVPDACPDILHIVAVCGQVTLNGKQAREGMAVVNGSVRATVLYQPEEGSGLRRLEVSLPFTTQMEVPGLTEHGTVSASIRLRESQARALNPRKVLLKVDLIVEITAFQRQEHICCQSVLNAEEHGVQQMITDGETYQLSAVQEKPFPFSDQIRINGGTGDTIQLLGYRAVPICSESKLIGNKLILKGSVELQCLMQEAGGALTTYHESMPFSQILEVPGVGESGDCRILVELTQISCLPAGEDSRTLEVSMDLLAQAQVWGRRPVTLLQDLYSTGFQTDVRREEQRLFQMLEQSSRPQTVRELLECGTLPRSVVDSWVTMGEIQKKREGDELVLSGEAMVTVLYLDENESIQAIQKPVPVLCRLDAPDGALCHCQVVCPGEVYATPAAGGIEVRFTMEFQCLLLRPQKTVSVCGAALGEARARGEENQPSVVLRLATPGEGLWELAKAYGTTTEQIIQANELDDEHLPVGRMLLIPSVRT